MEMKIKCAWCVLVSMHTLYSRHCAPGCPPSSLTSHVIALLWVTVQDIRCDDRRLHPVLWPEFSQWCGAAIGFLSVRGPFVWDSVPLASWCGGPRCFIFLGARALKPAVFAACFSFHVRSPSRCSSEKIGGRYIRGIFAAFFALHAHVSTRKDSSERAIMLTHDIPLNWDLHLWFFPISIASRCGIQNLVHKCSNNAEVAPRYEETLKLCRVHEHFIIHKHEATFSTEHRYNTCVVCNTTQSAHTHQGRLRLSLFVAWGWGGNNLGVFKLVYIRSHLSRIFLIVQCTSQAPEFSYCCPHRQWGNQTYYRPAKG